MLQLKHIHKTYYKGEENAFSVFEDFHMEVKKGEFVSIIGSNGSGKTSLLNMICGTIKPDSGQIYMKGKDILKWSEAKRNRYISRVYQDPSAGVCPSMTILENMALFDQKGKRYGLGKGVQKSRIVYYKEQLASLHLGLEDKLHVPAGNLSGGQRQALSLLLAVMTPVDMLLLDEHTAALDPKTADRMMELTEQIVREKQLTTIMITHNLKYAANYGNRLVMMHQGQCILDERGEKKKAIQAEKLMEFFQKHCS